MRGTGTPIKEKTLTERGNRGRVTKMDPEEFAQAVEGHDLEAKLAAGRDGQGALPLSFFESYSAFANTDGGVVLLGVEEKRDGKLKLEGLASPKKYYGPCGTA